MWQTAKRVYANEGLLSFYKGLGTNLLGSLVALIQFPLYEKLKRHIANQRMKLVMPWQSYLYM